MSLRDRVNEYVRAARERHPAVPMTFAGKHLGTGGAAEGDGVYVHCGNAGQVALHLATFAADCPWTRLDIRKESETMFEVIAGVHPDAPGLEGGPTHRGFLKFALAVLRRQADECMRAGSEQNLREYVERACAEVEASLNEAWEGDR